MNYPRNDQTKQISEKMAHRLGERLEAFVKPLLLELDQLMDKRLVRTFLTTLQVIIQFRHRSHGLLLSERGFWPHQRTPPPFHIGLVSI